MREMCSVLLFWTRRFDFVWQMDGAWRELCFGSARFIILTQIALSLLKLRMASDYLGVHLEKFSLLQSMQFLK